MNKTEKIYSPQSYFFTDLVKLADFTGIEGFGPVSGSETTKYRVTSKVRANDISESIKLYAICKGSMMIQPQDGDNTKINIIIKPSENSYAPLKIKYFIYRGVNKADYFTGNILNQPDPSKPETLKKMWTFFMALNGLSSPVGAVFPLDYIYQFSAPETKHLDEAFQSSLINCKKGEFIGNFKGELGLDIILDHGESVVNNQLFNLDLKFSRAKEYIFDTTALTDNVQKNRLKENIQQFLDAAAFWGSHINSGTIILKDGSKKINEAEISPILKKYQTKNKIYIYLQGENNRSFNYYDTSRKVYFNNTIAGELNNNGGLGWPILIKEINGASGSAKFQFDYTLDSNLDKIEISTSIDLIATNKTNLISYPLREEPQAYSGKTKEIKILFPMSANASCANFVFFNILSVQKFPVDSYFNNIWVANIKSSVAVDPNVKKMHWCVYDKNLNVDLNDTIRENAILQNKVIFDEGKRTIVGVTSTKRRKLFASIIKNNSGKDDEHNRLNMDRASFGSVEENTSLNDYMLNVFNDAKLSIYKGTFVDNYTIPSSTVNSLTLFHEESPFKKNSYMLLGITEDEYSKFSIPADADNIFFNLLEEPISSFSHENIRKFKLGLRYENGSGVINTAILYPSVGNEVYVYSVDDLFFFSAEYSKYQEFYKEFSKSTVEFRTVMDQTNSVYHFNPITAVPGTIPFYKGEFGFDWLRIGDNGEPAYKNHILRDGYERPSLNDPDTEYESNLEAYKFLKRRYKSLPTQKTDEQYYIPYLSLFSKTYSDLSRNTPKPTFQARLRVLVQIEENLGKLEFDYDPKVFSISKTALSDKTPASTISKKESIDQTIMITCLKSFSETKAIKVLAYPAGVTNRADAKLAGVILVDKNEKINKVNIALVAGRTNISQDAIVEKGIYMNEEILNLKRILYQNLLDFNIKEGLTLDLTADANFRQAYNTTVTPPVPITKNFIHADGGLLKYQDNIDTNIQLHTYARTKFLAGNSTYNNYFTVFAFDVRNTKDNGFNIKHNTLGSVEKIGIKNVVLFNPLGSLSIPRDVTTLNHECMHGYNLFHTHLDDSPVTIPQIEFLYPPVSAVTNILEATDNVMSYNDKALVLWNWQKKHINITI